MVPAFSSSVCLVDEVSRAPRVHTSQSQYGRYEGILQLPSFTFCHLGRDEWRKRMRMTPIATSLTGCHLSSRWFWDTPRQSPQGNEGSHWEDTRPVTAVLRETALGRYSCVNGKPLWITCTRYVHLCWWPHGAATTAAAAGPLFRPWDDGRVPPTCCTSVHIDPQQVCKLLDIINLCSLASRVIYRLKLDCSTTGLQPSLDDNMVHSLNYDIH